MRTPALLARRTTERVVARAWEESPGKIPVRWRIPADSIRPAGTSSGWRNDAALPFLQKLTADIDAVRRCLCIRPVGSSCTRRAWTSTPSARSSRSMRSPMGSAPRRLTQETSEPNRVSAMATLLSAPPKLSDSARAEEIGPGWSFVTRPIDSPTVTMRTSAISACFLDCGHSPFRSCAQRSKAPAFERVTDQRSPETDCHAARPEPARDVFEKDTARGHQLDLREGTGQVSNVIRPQGRRREELDRRRPEIPGVLYFRGRHRARVNGGRR